MDNDRATTLTFVPDRRYTAFAAAGAALAACAAALTDDPPGRLLFAIGAVLLAAYAISDLVFSPRLVVRADGVTIRAPLTRATVTWDEIESLTADSRIRLGLRATILEIDAGTVLAVFSRRAIGADPGEAAALANALRPSPGGGSQPHDHDDEGEDGA